MRNVYDSQFPRSTPQILTILFLKKPWKLISMNLSNKTKTSFQWPKPMFCQGNILNPNEKLSSQLRVYHHLKS